MPEELPPDVPPEEAPTLVMGPPRPEDSPAEAAENFQYQVVDISRGANAEAVAQAEERINQQTTEHGLKGALKRIWFGNLARDYYRQKWIDEGRREIAERQDVYALAEVSEADKQEAVQAIIERVAKEHLHEGESNEDITSTEAGQQLSGQINELIRSFARGEIDVEALEEEKTRILTEYGHHVRQESGDRNRGLVYADNILEVAANVRAAVEHEAGIDRLDAVLAGVDGKLGEARTGVRTEARLQATDKIIDWAYRHHLSGVNETTLALGVGAVMTAAKFTTRKAATAAGAALGLGVGAGVIAGAREHLHVGQERALHMRQRAEGSTIEEGSNRREQLEGARYETVSAQTLTDGLRQISESIESGSLTDAQSAAALITEVHNRIHLSDTEAMDLIDYSSKTAVESERLELDIEFARAKVALRRAMESGDVEMPWPGEDLDGFIERTSQESEDLLRQDIGAKDRIFKKIRRQRTLKMAAIGFITGETLGLAFQELHSLVDNGLLGVFEKQGAGNNRQTLLAGLFHHTSYSSEAGQHREFFEGGHHLQDVAVKLPPGYHLVDANPGEKFGWQIQGPDGKNLLDGLNWHKWSELIARDHNPNHFHHIAEGRTGVGFDKQGNLDFETRQALRSLGFNLTQQHLSFHEPRVEDIAVTRNIHEYLQAHPKDFTHVNRELWYDNNTPGVYDQNELKLWWGAGGVGIDGQGNYVLNVSHMTADGSFHDGLSANAQELARTHQLALALSMSKDTQQFVKLIPIDANGNAVIPAHSFEAQALFENRDGQAHFIGAYAEVDQLMGKTADGHEGVRMLATLVGDGQPRPALDIVHHLVSERHTHFMTNIEAPKELPIEIPPVLPLYGRRGLESMRQPEGGGGYGYGYMSESYVGGEEAPRRVRVPFAREVESNPDAAIDGNKTTEKYLGSLSPAQKRKVDNLAKQLEKQPKADKPKVVVMIPAAAHQEGANIYRTLEQYAKQQDVGKNEFEVVVFANNPRGTKRDKTISEIQRFQQAYPDMNVRLIERQLEPDEARIGWVRKTMTDTVLTELQQRGVDLNEVLLVSNDADSLWIDDSYIRTIIDKAEAQPEVDGFLGFIDWGYDAYRAHPETLVATRLMQMIEIYLRRSRNQIGSSGANFVFRPSAYTAVGGYRTSSSLGEDVELGRMIKGMRSGASTRRPIAFLGRSSEINTSARRALDKLFKDGGAPARQWEDEFTPYDDLRTREFDLRDFDFSDRAAVRRLVASTQRMLNDTVRTYGEALASEKSDTYRYGRINVFDFETMRNLNRMLSIIGVKVKWQPNGRFEIVDARRMVANLKRWQLSHGGGPQSVQRKNRRQQRFQARPLAEVGTSEPLRQGMSA